MASPGPEERSGTAGRATRLTGSDAVRLHLTLAGGLTLCLTAFIIELLRALGGHSFSWIYVFEWPLFAGFAVYMWWNLLHGSDRAPRTSAPGNSPPSPVARDEGLDAWTVYLAVMESAEGEDPARLQRPPGAGSGPAENTLE